MDKTYAELEPQCLEILAAGGTFHAKFTCKHCGARQTFETPNQFYTQGQCEECGKVSDLDKYGLIVVMGLGGPTVV